MVANQQLLLLQMMSPVAVVVEQQRLGLMHQVLVLLALPEEVVLVLQLQFQVLL
tara:strand:+ start:175 stop:336 length:162 start_codon:yes stop_codon:yes gene_type:complete